MQPLGCIKICLVSLEVVKLDCEVELANHVVEEVRHALCKQGQQEVDGSKLFDCGLDLWLDQIVELVTCEEEFRLVLCDDTQDFEYFDLRLSSTLLT